MSSTKLNFINDNNNCIHNEIIIVKSETKINLENKLLSINNISRYNYSPELKKKIKKSLTYQTNFEEMILNNKNYDNDYSRSVNNDISNIIPEINNNNSKKNDTTRSILSLFFKAKIIEKQDSGKHAITPTNATNTNNFDNKNQMKYNSIFKTFFGNFSLFLVGSFISLLTCILFVSLTYLLRKGLNLIDNNLKIDQNLNIERNVSNIKINCNFCYFSVWFNTSLFSFVYPIYFIYHLVSLYCFKKNDENNEQKQNISQFLINSLHIFDKNQSKIKNSVQIESLKLNKFGIKILSITIVWVLTGYTFLRGLDLIICSDFVILFSVNISFTYMASWIILRRQFLPLRVIIYIIYISLLFI